MGILSSFGGRKYETGRVRDRARNRNAMRKFVPLDTGGVGGGGEGDREGQAVRGDGRRGRFDDRLRDRTETSARIADVWYVPILLTSSSRLFLSLFFLLLSSSRGPFSPPAAETSAN